MRSRARRAAAAGVLEASCAEALPLRYSLSPVFRVEGPSVPRALPARSLSGAGVGGVRPFPFEHRHRMMQDYPLNLSISLSGGEETNQDAPSNGE